MSPKSYISKAKKTVKDNKAYLILMAFLSSGIGSSVINGCNERSKHQTAEWNQVIISQQVDDLKKEIEQHEKKDSINLINTKNKK